MFKRKGAKGWVFTNGKIMAVASQFEGDGPDPELYLCESLNKAKAIYREVIQTHKASLIVIKISIMNRYNLQSESEVVGGTYREFKENQ